MNVNQERKKKLVLGKGIASLLEANTLNISNGSGVDGENRRKGNSMEESSRGEPFLVKLADIQVNPYQPRKIFQEEQLRELACSIEEVGLIQPIVVSREGDCFEIISGERRFRASKMAGLEQVPVIVRKVTDRDKLALALIENIQRSELNCVEEGLAYYQLMDEFNLSQEEVARRVGKDRSTVANFLRILKLPREVIALLQGERISFGHAKVLAGVRDEKLCTDIAKKIALEGLSVRQIELLIKKEGKREKGASTKAPSAFNEKLAFFKESLERKTGYRFDVKAKKDFSGQVVIHYDGKKEFDKIFEHLMG